MPDNPNPMIAALNAQGFSVLRTDDRDVILLELARLKRLERTVITAAQADYAIRHLLKGLAIDVPAARP